MKGTTMIYTVLRVPLDFCALIGAGIATYIIRTNILDSWRPVQFAPELPLSRFMLLIVGVSLWFVLVYAVSGLYSMKQRMSLAQEVARSLVASSAAMMGVILTIFLRAEAFNSRFLVLGYWIIAMTCVVVGRITMHSLIRYATARYGVAVRRLLLIGNDAVTQQLSEALRADRGLGYRIEAELQHPDMEAVSRLVSQGGIDEVILATPDYPAQGIVELVEFCHEHHVSFKFVPNIYQTLTTHYDVDAIGRIPLVQLRRTALEGWGRVFKAILDRVGSLFALLILAIPMLAIGFCIKWETAGPLFVRLNRVSRGRTFGLYKFRSMIENAEELKPMLAQYNERSDGPLFKMRDDPRVTRVGRILRRTRLDELPQLLNVLRGDMSLVGPRPHQPDEIARYQKHHRRVLDIKAGVTGLAQVSGSSSLPFEEEVQLDTFYIENWTLATDVRILVRTALKLLTDRTAV